MIIRPAVSEFERCLGQSLINRSPSFARGTVDWDRSTPPMVGPITEGEVVLEANERRENVVPSPAVAPLLLPAVEVFRYAADRDLTIDCRASSHALAAPVWPRLLAVRSAGQEGVVPELTVLRIGNNVEWVWDLHCARGIGSSIVGTCFEEQNGRIGVLAQSSCQRCSARSRPDDDVVIDHSAAALIKAPSRQVLKQ